MDYAKKTIALFKTPPQTMHALETLGSHLAVARVRRKESLATRAKRIGVSIPTPAASPACLRP